MDQSENSPKHLNVDDRRSAIYMRHMPRLLSGSVVYYSFSASLICLTLYERSNVQILNSALREISIRASLLILC